VTNHECCFSEGGLAEMEERIARAAL